MTDLHVDLAVLRAIATSFDTAATGLEDLAGDVPTEVDAGLMTGVIASMLSQVTASAGSVSTSLSGAADLVEDCRAYFRRADADADADLSSIQEVMEP